MNINPVNHQKGDTNRYCGPSAISIVTGMASGEAARLLRHVSGKSSIKGTSDWHMQRALSMCGITAKSISVKPTAKPSTRKIKDGFKTERRPTIAEWLRNTAETRSSGRVFLVSAGHHWQIITGRRFCCGQTKAIVSLTHEKVHRRARVDDVYELIAHPQGIKVPSVARKANATATITAKDRSAFATFCRHHKLDWHKASDGYIEIDPCDEFPDGLTFLFDDWSDAIQMVRRALNDPLEVIDGYLSH